MKKIALGLALGVAFAACEQEPGETDIGDEAAAETEQAMEETGEAIGQAGEEVEMAFADWDADASGVIDEEEFDAWWEDVNPFDDWDVDADGTVTEEELSARYSAHFSEWDADGDRNLTEEEVRVGLFDLWDTDNDGDLAEEEWHPAEIRIGTN